MASGPIDSVDPPAAAAAAAASANASGSHMAYGSIDSVNPAAGGAAANASHRLDSILLDRQRPYIITMETRRNETTATAKSKGGYLVSVSFWMAEPPGISCFTVHCDRCSIDPTPGSCVFAVPPHVVGADGPFVLLRARLSYGYDEYFMYNAGYGELPLPSLEWIPLPDDDYKGTLLGRVSEFGVVPCDSRDHYLLAALCGAPDAPADYHLRIYSSETKAWSTRTLLNPCPGVRRIIPDKVISLGGGCLGWVDFSFGLVACDLRQDPPVGRFIPLPEPLPGNRDKVEASLPIPGAPARSFRDLACFSGVIKFFEMERHMTDEEPNGPTDKDILYDSELITSLKRSGMNEKKPKSRDRWRAVTWSRKVCSNFWSKECTLSVDDILVDETKHSALVKGKACGKPTLGDLYSAFPTLSTDSDDYSLYLMSVAEPGDRSGWVVAVDLRNRTVKGAVACSFNEHDPSNQAFRPCTLSRYLNMTPGTEISGCRDMVGGSASIKMVSKDAVMREMRERLLRRRLPLVKSNPQMKQLTSIVRMPWENKRARNEPHSIVQNDHVSEVQPVQAQANLQCFNKVGQPPNPAYIDLPSAPLLLGYENSQILWQQPSTSNKPLDEFHPREVAQPCFNQWAGTSNLGYSEQFPACNTFPYDTHSDYVTYQQQLQQPPSSEELPAIASCGQPLLPPHQLPSCGSTS